MMLIELGMETPPEDLVALKSLVLASRRDDCKKTIVIEVGSWAGQSARVMESAGALVYCVDTWEGTDDPEDFTGILAKRIGKDDVYSAFCTNAADRCWKTIVPIRSESLLAAKLWPHEVDMIFIDADHRYEAVKADIEAWLPHVRRGGVICGHDYFVYPGVKKAVDEIFGDRVHTSGLCVWWVEVDR